MTLSCIWLSGSKAEDLGSAEYSFLTITPNSPRNRSRSTRLWVELDCLNIMHLHLEHVKKEKKRKEKKKRLHK